MRGAPAHTMVYVRGSSLTWHVDRHCAATRAENETDTLGTCSAAHAHQSCLTPCAKCASALADTLKADLGNIPSGERKRRSRPRLQPVPHPTAAAPSRTKPGISVDLDNDASSVNAPYGAPTSADDPRFSNASNAGWGAAAYAQHHDEFLGENTDDDNDWRGAGRFLD